VESKVRAAVILVVTSCSCSLALVSAYHLGPVSASQSGWTRRGETVSQVITCNFDELDSLSGAYCELFTGQGGGAGCHLEVLTYPGGFTVAEGNPTVTGDHKWAKFRIGVEVPESIVKGRQLEFRFTRSGIGA